MPHLPWKPRRTGLKSSVDSHGTPRDPLPEPSDTLRGLAAQGRQLLAEYLAAQRAERSAQANAALGTDLLDFFFDLSGYKRAVGRIGKGMAYSSAASKETDVRARYDSWESAVRSTLRDVTVVHKQVPRNPNSTVMLRRFATSQHSARLDTRLEHGVRFLDTVAEERLVRNEDLAALKPAPRVKRAVRPATAEGVQLNPILIEGPQVLRLLEPFPSERQAIEGALGVYQAKTADYGRQALNSCRHAIENLTKLLSGEGDWNVGLTKVLTGDAERQIVRKAHVFLSAYGTHGEAGPDLSTIEMGISLTFVALRLLLTRGKT